MNSLLLGRNGRLLMPILALLLMNVPVAEAKFEWPEGTMGNFAMVGLVFTSITVGSGMLSILVYLFRTLFGIPHESHTETDRRLRESKEWLEYVRWIATQNPTTHPVDEGAAVRVLDLEKQLFEEPPPTRALPVRFLKYLIRTAKSYYTSVTSRSNSTNENSRHDKGKAPEERHIPPHPLIQIATGEGLKIGVYHAIYPATAACRSRKSAHRHRSAKIVRDPGEIGIHYASYKPRGASIKSTDKTKSRTTNKDGGKISAYGPKRQSRKPIHRCRAEINSFHRFLRATKNGFAPPTIITGDDLTIENTHRNKGKAPGRRVPAPSQIPTVHRHRHRHRSATTIEDGVMNATHGSAKSAHRSRKSTHGHRHRLATHHSSKSARRSRKSTHRRRSTAHHSARRRSRRSTHRHKLAKIFRGFSHTAKNGIITLASGGGSTKSRFDKGKAPEPRTPLQSEISTAHRHRHRSKHTSTKDGTKARTHGHHHTCSKFRSKHATSKADGKSRTHRHHHTFLNHNADKTYESWNQHDVISPPPQVHTVAISSKHADNAIEPAATSSSHHAHLSPYKPLIRFALDPIRPPCPPHRARKPFQSGAPISVFHLSRLLSRKPVSQSGGSIPVFDSLQSTSRKSVPPPGAPVLVHYRFEPEYLTPVPSSASSSILDLSHAISRKPVPPPGAFVSVLDLSQPASRKPVPPTAPPSRADLSHAISRKPVPPSGASISLHALSNPESRKPVSSPASSSIANLSDTGSRKAVSPPASSSIADLSDTGSRKAVSPPASSRIASFSDTGSRNPVSPPASSSLLNSSGTICRKPVFPSASSSMADLSETKSLKPVSPLASSSILNSSDAICHKPISHT